MANVMHADMGEIETEPVRPKVTDAKGILLQNREFLDFFWDIAKSEQEIRLKAIENLVEYLKNSNKPDELKYTLKRLVDGLGHTREIARPGFSLALGQVLSVFEDVPLQSALDLIKEKHNLETVKKKLIRNALFGNFFGVLALSQSNRLSKEPQVVLQCVQLLQSLSQHREHLKDLPRKTMVDILNETPVEVFEEVLLRALKSDLSSAFSTPEQLQLLLVALQRFPQVLKPKKLNKLLGTSTIVTPDNIPKLTEVMRIAARSVKKDKQLPGVALDLLQVSLKEKNFELFWNETIINGMLKDPPGPTHYLAFRLLGSALPLLSLSQIKQVLSGDVMRHYGEHVVSAQLPDRFKFAPEMETNVGEFLRGCPDEDKQMAVMKGFSLLTNQGYPVVPSVWRVVSHLQPQVLRSYVSWLQDMFLHPHMDACLDFSTRRQKENQEEGGQKESSIFRLRKWIIPRLVSIVENSQVKKEEDLVMDIARFVFFHAFFSAAKATPDIPETNGVLSVPLDDRTRAVLVNGCFGILQHMNHLPVLGVSLETEALNQRRVRGVRLDGSMWIYFLVQFADSLLKQPQHACSLRPFSTLQRQAWDSMLSSVATLRKRAEKANSPEGRVFQQLFLLVGIHLFKAPDDFVELMTDLQSCMQKAQERKSKRRKKSGAEGEEEEPHWAEVVVDILLSLLSQPSRHIRQVCKTVFTDICPHVTARALNAILDVLDPDKDEEDSAVVVTDDGKKSKDDDQDEDMEEDSDASEDESDEDEDDDDDDDDDDDEELEEEDEPMQETAEVDQNFRIELMKVLQNQNALATEGDGSEDEEMDDEAMMNLDGSIAALFLEQKKKTEAKKHEKERARKEKVLVRDFKIKVLDLVEVFLSRQGSSPLVLGMVEPLLGVIEAGMSSDTDQQEQDFLRKAADIFRNQLCRAKLYCRTVSDRQAELHDLLEKLLTKTQKLSDSSVSLYFFSACLYLVKVLRGAAPSSEENTKSDILTVEKLSFLGSVDLERVTAMFKEALVSFMTRRKSPLTGHMFTDLFTRFPVLCVKLLDTAVDHITAGVRDHQQGQASALVLGAVQNREVQVLLAGSPWTDLCHRVLEQLSTSLEAVEKEMAVQSKNKVFQEKVLKALELCNALVKIINKQKFPVDLQRVQGVLRCLSQVLGFRSGQLADIYWAIMKHFGVQKPKLPKTKQDVQEQEAPAKKKKGFLPESKKRKNRKKQVPVSEKGAAVASADQTGGGEGRKKNKNKRKRPGAAGGGEGPSQPPVKKAKAQPPGKMNQPPGKMNQPPGKKNQPPGKKNQSPGKLNQPPGKKPSKQKRKQSEGGQ
ncbi:myb-binding protein 1A-like protein isoform X2 [Osmerus eperlanus]|uniref:myb-binding protein 1A-like protein isoform X2 n=1 Tax=Osmerus eperlanus TaxID=29151 RepID=UPI002E13376A